MPGRTRTIRSPLFRKLLIGASALVLTMGGLTDLLMSRFTRQSEESAVQRSLHSSARLLARELESLPSSQLPSWVRQTDTLLSARVTVVDSSSGTVLAESRRQPGSMDNHSTRPEIQAALRTGLGVAKRHSSSVNTDFLYLALPARLANGQPVLLRLAAPLAAIESAVADNRSRILRATFLLALAVLAAAYFFTRSLTSRIHRIQAAAEDLAAGRFDPVPLPPDSGKDELGALSASLHRMAGNLLDMVELLRNESARREAILSSMREGVLAVDSSLTITFCNQAFLDAVAASSSPAPGTPLEKIAPDAALLDPLWQVLERGETIRAKISFPASPVRSYELWAKPLELNRQKGALAILHDVTELERLERVRRDFVANVSHELRTPLAAISGYAETLLDGAIDDSAHNRRFLEVIRANAIRLNNIASDLLVLSELEQHRPAQEPAEPVPLQPVIDTVVRTVESAARLRHIRILTSPAPWSVRALRFRLEQALVNLLDNAVKFSHENSDVRIEASRVDGMIEIHVIDRGIGIPEEDLPRIFERFYRVDKARSREAGGTGLGLSIVKHIAELFGGSVRVSSRLGQGSTFTLSLPAA